MSLGWNILTNGFGVSDTQGPIILTCVILSLPSSPLPSSPHHIFFCPNWAVHPQGREGQCVSCSHCIPGPALGSCSLNICLMSERRKGWCHPLLGKVAGFLEAPFFFFFFKEIHVLLFIYLFIFGCVESSFLCEGFL